ncbi:pyridoxal phosphate enzyme (YggS family) [Natronobacillus azotifigens]|uniref:Pyridoxal phosphate homeostasis protein n=1 Tax=Natronobacillus azotifigens TaxID=472978 RepID=A0A9J6RDA5_9BACI|nr:YggS family pyridoxal phosphate-dependent enzyme [Natronobacillus azotifigens]MCZ0703350.1 YggS family pyridoxal phosphate-dependent enzyme [Natronobacillus azotifigens]
MTVEENLATIQSNLQETCARIGRDPQEITVIAVTKYVTIERAREVIKAGVTNLAENRMEGLYEKSEALNDTMPNWHFIGTLQSKKVKKVIDLVDYLHSLDRLSLAKEINKRAQNKIPCFVQVNVSGETSKQGLKPEEVDSFIEKLKEFEQIQIVGLMTMAPHVNDDTTIRNCFRELRELRDRIASRKLIHAPCSYLSMGMSNDYQIAIEEGATHIRIGSHLVGQKELR